MAETSFDTAGMDFEHDAEFAQYIKENTVDQFPHEMQKQIEDAMTFGMNMMFDTHVEIVKHKEYLSNVPASAKKLQTTAKKQQATAVKRGRNGKKVVPDTQPKQRELRERKPHQVASKPNDTKAAVVGGVSNEIIPKGYLRMEIVAYDGEGDERNFVGKVGIVAPLAFDSKQVKKHVKIGRSATQQYKEFGFSLKGDYAASEHHAKIICKREQFYLQDVGSSNGTHTYPNDESIKGDYKLEDGELLKIGGCVIQFNL